MLLGCFVSMVSLKLCLKKKHNFRVSDAVNGIVQRKHHLHFGNGVFCNLVKAWRLIMQVLVA